MTLKKQIAQLREQHVQLIEEGKNREKEAKEEHKMALSFRADHLMKAICDELKKVVERSSGISDEAVLYIIGNSISDKEKPADAATVRRLVKERSGIEVRLAYPGAKDHKQQYWVRVDMNSDVRVYTLPTDEKNLGVEPVILDFPALFTENEWRARLWQEQIKTIARKAVDRCCLCLKCADAPYYAFGEKTLLYAGKYSAFEEHYELDGRKLLYCYLTATQLTDLKKEMDVLVSGGEVELSLNDDGVVSPALWATVIRRPEKVVKDAYFDYEEFCKPYDEVTKPLQDVFDKIISGLEFSDVASQIAALVPDHRLMYRFAYFDDMDPLNYARVKRGLEGRRHERSFIEAVNKAFPAIRVTKVTFNTNNTRCHIGNLVLEYEILDKEADSVREQVAAEEVIKYVKQRMTGRFARAVLDVIMADIEDVGMSFLFKNDCNRRACHGIRDVGIVVNTAVKGLEQCEIILAKIKDEKFIARVERTINRLTDGLVLVNVRRAAYKLNFSDEVGSAQCPLTLEEYDKWVWDRADKKYSEP